VLINELRRQHIGKQVHIEEPGSYQVRIGTSLRWACTPRVRSRAPERYQIKIGTPTMGGILLAPLLALVAFGWLK
jgi:hypothetical protein